VSEDRGGSERHRAERRGGTSVEEENFSDAKMGSSWGGYDEKGAERRDAVHVP
jgi:hypothetical protein